MAKEGVSVVVATFNGEEYMGPFLASLEAQTRQSDEIIIIDNSPNTLTQEAIKATGTEVRLFPQDHNLDFSAGYNAGMRLSEYEMVLVLNQDMEVDPRMIERLVKWMEDHPRCGAVAPLLLRSESEIDARGISVKRSRKYSNIDEGRPVERISSKQPFGVSGAAILFRRSALHDIAENGGGGEQEFFDEQFVAYKEDIDISYRLHHRGWEVSVCEEAVAYHVRTARDEDGDTGVIRARKNKNYRINGNSYRNQFWVLLKNEPLANLLLHAPLIVGYELLKTVFIALVEPSTLRILPSLLRGLPKILRKRRYILGSSLLGPGALRRILFRS